MKKKAFFKFVRFYESGLSFNNRLLFSLACYSLRLGAGLSDRQIAKMTGWHHNTIANNKAALISAGLAKEENNQLHALRPEGPFAASVKYLRLSSQWHDDLHYLRFYSPSDRKKLDLRQAAIWSLAYSIAGEDGKTGPLTASYFAASLGLHHATVQKDIAKLIDLGLLVRGHSDRSSERFRLAIPAPSELQLALFADYHSGEEQFIWPSDFAPSPNLSNPNQSVKKPQPPLTAELLTDYKPAIELLRLANIPDNLIAELIEEVLLSGILLKDFQKAIRVSQKLNDPDKFDHCGYLLRNHLRKNLPILRTKCEAAQAKEKQERRELAEARATIERRQREAEAAYGNALTAPWQKELILSRVRDHGNLERLTRTYPESAVRQVLSTLPVRGENHEKVDAFEFLRLLRKHASRQNGNDQPERTQLPERTPEQQEDALIADLIVMR